MKMLSLYTSIIASFTNTSFQIHNYMEIPLTKCIRKSDIVYWYICYPCM